MKNTLEKGSVRTIIFKEDGVWYGAALEFNIVVDAQRKASAISRLNSAIKSYLEAASKVNSSKVLNQKPDAEYEKLWNLADQNKAIPSPIQIDSIGRTLIHA